MRKRTNNPRRTPNGPTGESVSSLDRQRALLLPYYENGTLKTGEGSLRVKVPQIRGQADPDRSQLWSNVSHTSEVLKKRIVEM